LIAVLYEIFAFIIKFCIVNKIVVYYCNDNKRSYIYLHFFKLKYRKKCKLSFHNGIKCFNNNIYLFEYLVEKFWFQYNKISTLINTFSIILCTAYNILMWENLYLFKMFINIYFIALIW